MVGVMRTPYGQARGSGATTAGSHILMEPPGATTTRRGRVPLVAVAELTSNCVMRADASAFVVTQPMPLNVTLVAPGGVATALRLDEPSSCRLCSSVFAAGSVTTQAVPDAPCMPNSMLVLSRTASDRAN